MKKIFFIVLSFLYVSLTMGETLEAGNSQFPVQGGEVHIPLGHYNSIVDKNRIPVDAAPSSYAMGASTVTVNISDVNEKSIANVSVKMSIEVFEDKWVSIPILPYGAAITRAEIDGEAIQLVQNSEWLSWATSDSDVVQLHLNYSVDALRSEQGFTLPLPLPRAASTRLAVNFPGKDLDMSIVPASNLRQLVQGANTKVTANIPTTSFVQLSWRVPGKEGYVISRAVYKGELHNDALRLTANYDLELFTAEKIKLPLLSKKITLNSIKVDGKEAVILAEGSQFAVLVAGRGKHRIMATFEASLENTQGPPSVSFPIPKVPISQFKIDLPGNKELQITPTTNVSTVVKNNVTTATVYLPLSNKVKFSWADAIPVDVQASFRANANIYHAFYAEEGVLHGQAVIDYDLTHGESSSLSFSLPVHAQVNRIESPMAGIADWTEHGNAESGGTKDVTVYFDRAIKDNYQLNIFYERLLSHSEKPDAQDPISIPLLKANGMHRQRGVVALLAGAELSLSPVVEKKVTRVGENQLPAFFRNQITQAIVHTYKYTSATPDIQVNTEAPERQQGKYDAQVDTLASLGEVTLRGSATVQLDVKSGSIIDLQLQLPKNINVLNVTGPSLRNYKINSGENTQNIDVEFTQEMLGQFRLEVIYEKILGDSVSELEVSAVNVVGAEVQHGRIAIEALTAVEVQAGITEQLSSLEINELPQQLVLKTTNPILLAFKYVKTELPQRLVLNITRHQELSVQEAAIEEARYQTLITADGLAVTTANFNVRNSRRQFLRLDLPEGSEVWSVFVDGHAEKPAKVNPGETHSDQAFSSILIKMLNSTSGFPVEVVYATQLDGMGGFGSITAQLPVPDMVATNTQWDVYLPAGLSYQSLSSNMTITNEGEYHKPNAALETRLLEPGDTIRPALRVDVPARGVLFSFEKLYANQSGALARFSVKYSSSMGNKAGIVISVLGILLIWLGIFALRTKSAGRVSGVLLSGGAVLLLIAIGYMNTDSTMALTAALLGGLVYVGNSAYIRIRTLRKNSMEDRAAPTT